jgi:uncharacterized membrane protein YhaH (DUF805 family)
MHTVYTSRWHDVSTSGVENTWQEHHLMLVYVYCIHFKVTWRVYVGRCKRMRGASFDASVCIYTSRWHDVSTSGVANAWEEHHLMLVYVYCIHFKVTWRVYVRCCKRMTGASFDASVCIYTSRWHDVSTSGVANAWQEYHLILVYSYCIHFKVTWRVYFGHCKRMTGTSLMLVYAYAPQGDMTCLRRALKTHDRSIIWC